MTRWITAALAFTFMFAGGFFLGGWFLMPHLPPYPSSRVSADHQLGRWLTVTSVGLVG